VPLTANGTVSRLVTWTSAERRHHERHRPEVVEGQGTVSRPSVAAVDDADEMVGEDRLGPAGEVVPRRRDDQVAAHELSLEGVRRDVQGVERDRAPGSLLGDQPGERLGQDGHRIRGHAHREETGAGGGVEVAAGAQQPLRGLDGVGDHRPEPFGQRSELEAATDPDQQLVVEELPEPAESAAHRRLAHRHAFARVREVPLLEEGM
jgi:hypothetical protein